VPRLNPESCFTAVEAEKAGRDGRSAEELLRRVQRLHDEEGKNVQATLRDLAERLEAVSKVKEQEAAKRAELQEQLRDLRTSSEKLRVTVGPMLEQWCRFTER
jgi:protein-disulfide isomerase-like protein with CxxC motif